MTAAPFTKDALYAPSARQRYDMRLLWLFAIIIVALPLLLLPLPPLTDLPGHVGRYRVMLDGGSQWYDFQWKIVGNLGVDLIVSSVAPILGLETTVKFTVVLVAVATATACLWLSREVHGRISPFVMFALPLVYSQPFLYGFLNYTLSMALALLALAWWLRLGREGRIALRAILFVPIGCAVWFAHIYGWAVLGLLVFAAELARQRQQGVQWLRAAIAAATASLPLAPPVLFLLLWRSTNGSGITTGFLDLPMKALSIVSVFRDRWIYCDLATIGVVFGAIYYAVRSRFVRIDNTLAYGAGALFVAFMLLPTWVFGSGFADLRLAPYALMLLLLAFRTDEAMPPRAARVLTLVAGSFFVVRLAFVAMSATIYSQSVEQELAAIEHMRPQSRIASIVAPNCADTWQANRLDHLGGLALARLRAFSNDQWNLPGGPLLTMRNPAAGVYRHDPSQLRGCDELAADPRYDRLFQSFPYAAFDYLWLITPPAGVGQPGHGAKLIWSNGVSRLYEIPHR